MKPQRLLDYLTIAFWIITSVWLVLAASGPDSIAHVYLHSDNNALNLWMSSIFTLSVTLLFGLILWRQQKLPRWGRMLPMILFALIIVCACLRPYTASNGSGSLFVIIWSEIPQFMMHYPGSVIASIIITLATWGSLRSLLATSRPAVLPRLAWIIPALYTVAVLFIAVSWFGFAHALLTGPSLF